MPKPTIRGYRSDDESSLLAAWNAALPYDLIDQRTFQRKVLLDANFDADWLSVAESEGAVAGFCLGLIRRVPLEHEEPERSRGWITAFGVVPEHRRHGIGDALLDRAMQQFSDAGCSEVLTAPYTPNYFVPGVDETNYAAGLAFLQKRGFETVSRALSMDANIVTLDLSWLPEREARLEQNGIEVRSLAPHEVPDLLAFLREHVPADWLRHARDVLTDATKGLATHDQFTVAVRDRQLLGYCQFEGEHFGPFGVRDDSRGQGVGTVLLARCLGTMRQKGLHNAWVLWTSDHTAEHVYSRFGFRETRRFSVLRKEL